MSVRSFSICPVVFHMDVIGPDGKVQNWMVEGGSPNALVRRGITKDALPIGTDISVDRYQAKDGTFKANGRDVTLVDGKRLFLGSSGTGGPEK